jgi:hypothetical protein
MVWHTRTSLSSEGLVAHRKLSTRIVRIVNDLSAPSIDFTNLVVEFLDSSDKWFIEQAVLALSGFVLNSNIGYCLA